MSLQSIPISEDFNDPQGRFRYVHAYNVDQRTQVQAQKHVDIRSFSQTRELIESEILPGLSTFTLGEEWSTGTVGPQADRRNWRGLSRVCAPDSGDPFVVTTETRSYLINPQNPVIRENLIVDPSFEGLNNWGGFGAPTLTKIANPGVFGNSIMRVITNGSSSSQGFGLSNNAEVEGGKPYTYSIYVGAPLGANLRVLLREFDEDEVEIGVSEVTFTGQGIGTRLRPFVTRELSPAATHVDAELRVNGAQTLTFYVDGALLEQSDTIGAYFDGDHFGFWQGAANNSRSSFYQPEPIDIATGFEDTDEIVVSLPAFPLSDLDLENTFIDFTSDPNGGFVESVSVSFNDHSTGLIDGDSALRFPRSTLDDLDLESITGVRFRIAAADACTFRVLAIRILGADWKYGAFDIDTIQQALVSTVAPTGSIDEPYEYTMPRLFRAADPSSEADPRPIDAGISVIFNSGSMSGTNRFAIYFRELVEDFLTQLDIDGMEMSELNGHAQPDTGDGKWDPRPLSEFDMQTMADLEGDLMQDLERIEDFDLASWFGVTMQWGEDSLISALDSEGNGSTFADVPELDPGTDYVIFINIEDNSFRAKLYPIDAAGNVLVNELIYDTTAVIDDFAIPRRKGRIGWDAVFTDGDVTINEVRSRHLVFAEYRSLPLESFTPVEGATIFAEHSPNVDLFTGLSVGPYGGNVIPDKSKANSDESFKISNPGTAPYQGVVSNLIDFQNFDDYHIEFDVYYPAVALAADNNLELYLLGENLRVIKLSIGNIQPDTWHHVHLYPVEGREALTGLYRLFWMQPETGQASTWWLDNIQVIQHSMRWLGRSVASDPWDDQSGQWMNFQGFVNQDKNGVFFHERGTQLQVAGQALKQDVTLGKVRAVPKYAELGRVVWGERESNIDLALAKTATASSTTAPHSASNAVDGSSTTRWASNSSDDEYLQIDLGTTKLVQSVLIDWHDDFADEYNIAVSLNGTDWIVATEEEIVHPGWKKTTLNVAQYARYVRINCVTRINPSGTNSLYTVKIFGGLERPTADFSTSAAGATISFDGSTSVDPDGRIISYVWNFGDGGQGYGKHISHTYRETGQSYNVTLTVVDVTGLIDTYTEAVGV